MDGGFGGKKSGRNRCFRRRRLYSVPKYRELRSGMRGAIGSNVCLQPGALASGFFFAVFGAAAMSGLMVA
jgi:hypothetical protein